MKRRKTNIRNESVVKGAKTRENVKIFLQFDWHKKRLKSSETVNAHGQGGKNEMEPHKP